MFTLVRNEKKKRKLQAGSRWALCWPTTPLGCVGRSPNCEISATRTVSKANFTKRLHSNSRLFDVITTRQQRKGTNVISRSPHTVQTVGM